MVVRLTTTRPRSLTGGRSARYDRRREARNADRALAPAWTDAAAAVVLKGLHVANGDRPNHLVLTVLGVMRDDAALASFVHGCRLDLALPERELALAIMRSWQAKILSCDTEEKAKAKVRSFLKPLRARKAARVAFTPLDIPPADGPVQTLATWLSADVSQDRLRDISKSKRITQGIQKWDTSWLDKPGVIVYERAAARVSDERAGKCRAEFARALIKHETLPTATANASDHYVLLRPGTSPRFLSVNECARAFGIHADGALFRMLTRTPALTPPQAVSCLGRSVHAGVARQIVRALIARGTLSAGARYGSDCSGIDLFASAVEAELGAEWSYEFASERIPHVRSGLLEAWAPFGLTDERCAPDARRPAGETPPQVDLYVLTPDCTAHSARNHNRTESGWIASLGDVWTMLTYVRERRPSAVVVENVNEPSIVEPLTGLLTRLGGYSIEGGVLTPEGTARAGMARERYFWVLTRTSPG